jgi:regulatory protein
MTIRSIKLQPCSEAACEVHRIGLSDGSLFSIKTSYLSGYQADELCVLNRELSAEEVTALRFASSCLRCEQVALRLVAHAEQTTYGLSRKLEQRGHGASSVRAVVSHLSELEIVSDHRYAELWLHSRLTWGGDSPRRLNAALCGKGIDRDVASAALKEALSLEKETFLIRRFLEKKRLSAESGEAGRSLKQMLRAEGFSRTALEAALDAALETTQEA